MYIKTDKFDNTYVSLSLLLFEAGGWSRGLALLPRNKFIPNFSETKTLNNAVSKTYMMYNAVI